MAHRLQSILDMLCSTPSVSGQELELAKKLVDWAKDSGLEADLQPLGDQRGSAIVRHRFGDGPAVLLSAHIDTLPHNLRSPRLHGLHGDRYFAPEVNNMKGALAAMIGAVLSLKHRDLPGSVTILAAGGECDTIGLGTLHALKSGLTADHAINGEPTNLRIQSTHAGVFRIRLIASGNNLFTASGAANQNANVLLARAVAGLDTEILRTLMMDEVVDSNFPRLNVGVIAGGRTPSMLASEATADLDVRVGPGTRIETVTQAISNYLVDNNHEYISVKPMEAPHFMNPPAFECHIDWATTTAVMDSHFEVTEQPAEYGAFFPEVFYGSDAPHLVAAGIPTCMYGPGFSGDIGAVNESISFKDVRTASKVYAKAVERLLTGA